MAATDFGSLAPKSRNERYAQERHRPAAGSRAKLLPASDIALAARLLTLWVPSRSVFSRPNCLAAPLSLSVKLGPVAPRNNFPPCAHPSARLFPGRKNCTQQLRYRYSEGPRCVPSAGAFSEPRAYRHMLLPSTLNRQVSPFQPKRRWGPIYLFARRLPRQWQTFRLYSK